MKANKALDTLNVISDKMLFKLSSIVPN